jgi:hypothetical protein
MARRVNRMVKRIRRPNDLEDSISTGVDMPEY